MKINFDKTLHDFEGEVIEDVASVQETVAKAAALLAQHGKADVGNQVLAAANGLEVKGVPLTLKKISLRALAAGVQAEQDPKKMEEHFDLGEKIRAGGELEITPEEASTLKSVISKAYKSALVAGQCCKLLNG